MEGVSALLIVTNNPLVAEGLPKDYAVDYENITYREILIKVRDLVYGGHRLYTHPLSGSVKPNETPYKSIVISKNPVGMEAGDAAPISGSIEVFDMQGRLVSHSVNTARVEINGISRGMYIVRVTDMNGNVISK